MATPKAKLNQLFVVSDGQPQYLTFAGRPDCQNGTFFCKLLLPDGTVVTSDGCRRKRDAEHDAARKALLQIGSPFESEAPLLGTKSEDEVWVGLKLRIETAFSNECVLNYKPLMEHFRAAIVGRGDNHAPVPATVLASLDTKIISLCKALDKLSESSPARALELVCMAAKGCSSLECENNWIRRVEPFPVHVKKGLGQAKTDERVQFDGVYIPVDSNLMVSTSRIVLESTDYYIDVLARLLGLEDGAQVLISRSITRAPSGTRLFWRHEGSANSELNIRASTLTGHPVYGNATLAAIGSTWKSEGRLFCDNVSLSCYYRLFLGKFPTGCFKLAREAVLTAELSPFYISKSRWRGPTPRSLLNEFCHQSHFLAPTVHSYSVKAASNQTEDHTVVEEDEVNSPQGPFMCRLKISAGKGIQEFVSERSYRNCNDAVQSACLRALLYFDELLTAEILKNGGDCLELTYFTHTDQVRKLPEFEVIEEAEKTGEKPPIGCIVHVEYEARLKGLDINEVVETHDDFEFELGSGAVLGIFDACIANMQTGQKARFTAPSPPLHLLLAVHEFSASSVEKILQERLSLEYTVTLLKYEEAPEARMESAVFSPPLSKQRIDFTLQFFQRSQATTLVDFGCGSGSFLEAVVEQPHCVHRVVGVDISQKSLTRASKSLQNKLSKLPRDSVLESVTLYEGSIAEADKRLCNFDLATCLEVVEHMDPEPLSRIGESILGLMSPKVFLVSTPNIEYNPILHRMQLPQERQQQQTDNSEDSSETDEAQRKPEPIKLRNDDHRFEWTRAEFADWATNLASRYGYSVEFSGVGGIEGQEPGFASQIAILKRHSSRNQVAEDEDGKVQVDESYSQLWRWTRSGD